jgi:predicted XRE-type DNA-binding protein
MSDSNALSLNQQLAQRAKTFCSNLGLTQSAVAALLKIDDSQCSRFLRGQANLSSEKTLKLVRLMSLSKRDLELKFGSPEKLTARLMHLQVKGQPLKLSNDGWIAGTGPVPNDGDITGVRTARDLDNADDYQQETIDFLRDQQNIHRSAIKAIDDYLSGIQKGKVNSGSTEPARRVNDNTRSQTPRPKPPQFSRR